MDTGSPMALSKCIDSGVVGTLTDMLAADHNELVDVALETLTHLSESETDGRTFLGANCRRCARDCEPWQYQA